MNGILILIVLLFLGLCWFLLILKIWRFFKKLKSIIFERFLIEGVSIYFKVIIVLFQCGENFILEANDMIDFNFKVNEFINDKTNTNILKKKIDEVFLNSHLIGFLRENLINMELTKFESKKKSRKTKKKCEKQIPKCFDNIEDPNNNFILKTDFFLNNIKNLYFDPFKKKINLGLDLQDKIFKILSKKNIETEDEKITILSKNSSLSNLNNFNFKQKKKK